MHQGTRPNFILIFAIGVSLFGSMTTLLIALYPPIGRQNLSWRKPLVGSVFTLVCVSGVVAAFFPRKCSEGLAFKKTEPIANSNVRHNTHVTVKGHHPDCGRFSSHVISRGGVSSCAACTGLIVGAIVALMGTTLYFFLGLDFWQVSLPAILVGELGLLSGFVQFRFKGYGRLIMNAFFVLATFLILIGVDKLAESAYIDLYVVGLIFFWLWTRVLISQWDHWRICHGCRLCETKEKRN
jgi:hypothetical protein